MTRALAVIGLLTFGLPPAAALAKAPQGGKIAPQHGAIVHKKSASAAHDGDATKAHAVASKARAAHAKATAAHKTTATHKATATRTKSSASHTRTARARHRTTSHGKVAAHRATALHGKAKPHTAKTARRRPLRELITAHATKYSVPQHLVRRIIAAESGYNPKARNGPYIGLMQIALPTARGLGYRGNAAGLTDPDTNLKYGVAYLANAYRVAGEDEDRAVQLYRSGYYYAAKRKGMVGELIAAR